MKHAAEWAPQELRALKEALAAGMSASQAATHLCNTVDLRGYTRNMVIGKANRMGLEFARKGHRRRSPNGAHVPKSVTLKVIALALEDVSPQDIAARVGIAAPKVSAALSRARKRGLDIPKFAGGSGKRRVTSTANTETMNRVNKARRTVGGSLYKKHDEGVYQRLVADVVEGDARPVLLVDLERHHCRAPMGDGFCGRDKCDQSSYCEGHHALFYERAGKDLSGMSDYVAGAAA